MAECLSFEGLEVCALPAVGSQATELALLVCPPRVPHVRHGVKLGVRYLPNVRSGGLRLQTEMTEAPTCVAPPLKQPTPRSSETPLTLCFQILFFLFFVLF